MCSDSGGRARADRGTQEVIRAELMRVAQAGRTTTYHAVAAVAGLDLDQPEDRAALQGILHAISMAEHAAGRPLLSVVVVLGRKRVPGRGFFALARALGLHHGEDDRACFDRELARVHAAWQ